MRIVNVRIDSIAVGNCRWVVTAVHTTADWLKLRLVGRRGSTVTVQYAEKLGDVMGFSGWTLPTRL